MYKGLYDRFANWFRGGNIWLYSDPHFGDTEMQYIRKDYIGDDEQVKNINAKVGKNDTIIFLGDIGDVSFIKKIRGYKVLIMGNHDSGASNYKRGLETIFVNNMPQEVDNHLFDEVYEGPLFINDKVLLSHEPLSITPHCIFNIHGHDHSGLCGEEGYGYNVCAEWINYSPVSLLSMLKGGFFSKVDNIHRFTIDKATERKGGKNNG